MKNNKNKIKICYTPSRIRDFGFDSLNIDIQELSYGALRMISKDISELAKKRKLEVSQHNHPVFDAYADLLQKLSSSLTEELYKFDPSNPKHPCT
jgi:hypothetical protein